MDITIKNYSTVLNEGYEYVVKRATGEITSLKTGWSKFDQVGLGGIDWGDVITLSSRPGVGKTLVVQSLARNLQFYNKDYDFNVLHFQFEMLAKNIAAREFAGVSKRSLRYLLSAKDEGMRPLTEGDLNVLKGYVESQKHRREYVVDTALTVFEMRQVIKHFYKQHKKPFIITLDHTLLVKMSPNEKNHQDKLQNLSTMMVETKKEFPVTWIILSQLNREIDNSERQVPGKLSNYPNSGDVYGSKKLDQ
ncbi:MAG: hypothetical protein EOL97_08565 [Spirochaetia bacterium]|nr:hypothetical protein [Spirochaetia bacterium]